MEYENRIPELIIKFLKGTLIADEATELDKWVCASEDNKQFFIKATNDELLAEEFKLFNREDITPRLNKTLEAIDTSSRGGRLVGMKKYLVAASLVVIAGAGLFFWTRNGNKHDVAKTTTTTNNHNDVQPGTEKAVLTLADGSKIVLDNSSNGTIAQQGSTVILKEDGLLAYNVDKTKAQEKMIYNTLTTARGEEYRSLVLADGTKVWLNSGSSIHYPTAFIGKERAVDVTGELYFEVAKNPSKPFRLSVNGMEIEVLGTHFNVNAYDDEATIKTTLLEGAVKIVAGGKVSFLKPGQQASLNKDGEIKIVNNVNLDEEVAWKNGMFLFEKDDIETIMRQVSRWYNVDIIFKDKISGHFVVTGISRTVPVSKLLSVLEMMGGVHFEIDSKKILVKH
jgi:ferric-dicitrate binding protein FerR (iron transport regulator)